ncbi:hypothetical protein ACFLQO_01400 [Candidatus Aenigmatarchaeota archaeon]
MKKAYAFTFILMISAALLVLFPTVHSQGHTIQVRLNINNTNNTVYVPGVGEMSAGSLGSATYSNPDHYYLASYQTGAGGYLTGLVAADGNSIGVSTGSGYHTLELDHDVGERALIMFSRGDWDNIEKEILGLEQDKFFSYPSPSFGYGLGDYYPVTIVLRYTDIDIDGNLDQSKGTFNLMIRNTGVSGGKPVVEIGKS